MKKEIKKIWIDCLNSGEYIQTTRPYLKQKNKYCVEAVLADIYIKSAVNTKCEWINDGIQLKNSNWIEYWILPECIKKEYEYQRPEFTWSDVKKLLGADNELVQKLSKRKVFKKKKKVTDMDEYEIIGIYEDKSVLNIVDMNHNGFTFKEIAILIDKFS